MAVSLLLFFSLRHTPHADDTAATIFSFDTPLITVTLLHAAAIGLTSPYADFSRRYYADYTCSNFR